MTFDLEPKCDICDRNHSPLTDCGMRAVTRREGWMEPIDNTSRPYDFLPDSEFASSDLITRSWATNAQAMHGWGAQTGLQAMHVLSTLMHHLLSNGDTLGAQILARVWRMNSPVLEHLTYGQKRATEMGEGLQKIGDLLELHVGDDVAKLAPEKLRQIVAEATLLRETLAMCERETPAVVIVAKHEQNTASVHLQSLKGEVTFAARSVRGALQLAVDGEREVKRNG